MCVRARRVSILAIRRRYRDDQNCTQLVLLESSVSSSLPLNHRHWTAFDPEIRASTAFPCNDDDTNGIYFVLANDAEESSICIFPYNVRFFFNYLIIKINELRKRKTEKGGEDERLIS